MWDTEADFWGQDAVDLFTYCRRTFGSLCAWDGPAGLIATDGRVLVGAGRPHGPAAGALVLPTSAAGSTSASESGVFGLDTTTIVASGQLQPGQMIALDTETGERLDSHQILAPHRRRGRRPNSATTSTN